jgi:predicted DCC family thiol-disulfide oxidoreductase YuxK
VELISDGDCGFCQRCVQWLSERLKTPVNLVTSQQLSDEALAERSLNRHDVECSVWLVGETRNFAGAEAISQLLRQCRGLWPLLGTLLGARVLSPFTRRGYRFVAKYRTRLPGSICSLSNAQVKR